MTPHQIQTHLLTWQAIWRIPDLAGKIRIEHGRRLNSTLGRCYPNEGRIRLNPRVLEEPEPILVEVLCHEAAHVAVHLLHGLKVRPHGAEWRELMRAAGYQPRAKLDRRELSPAFQLATQPKALYLHRCPACGASRTARRRVSRWRCRACYDAGLGGRLVITSQAAARAEDA